MSSQTTPIQHILIVGGGTAGWLAAAYLARVLLAQGGQGARPEAQRRITLVESADIGIIGVGEGTFPSIRTTLSLIGIPEGEFLRGADASFKQGVRFADWLHPPGSPGTASYFHPFSAPSTRQDSPELLPYWLQGGAGPNTGFAAAVTLQKAVVDACRGPKRIGDPDYQGRLNYAYHFDASKFAGVLRVRAEQLGVQRIEATVRRVELDAAGAIAAVHTDKAGVLTADLYVDCTGFRAELIGRALGSPFHSVADQLFVDRAVAIQVPYARPDSPIASCTISTAQEAGWIWDIGLRTRRGLGYVYSSAHAGATQAEQALRDHIGDTANGVPARHLAFEVGYRPTQWIGNCVAIGLSSGFLEPLESSGIGLIETSCYLLAHLFPADGNTAPAARIFNELMAARYARVVDFLKLHYAVTQRRDTPFWRDNADPATRSPALADKLAMWRARPPHRLDFIADLEMYPTTSWQFVLYGLEYPTQPGPAALWPGMAAAQREFATLRGLQGRAAQDLPDHRALLDSCAVDRMPQATRVTAG